MQTAHKQADELQIQFSHFIKRVKSRQQQHHRIIDYNNRIINRRQQLQKNIFINDQISKHRVYMQQRVISELSYYEIDKELGDKCDKLSVSQQILIILMKRVASRVLQMTFSAVEAMRETIQYYLIYYNKFKLNCFRSLNQNYSFRASHIIKIISKYLHHKWNVQIDRLKEIIKLLEKGELSSLLSLKNSYYQILIKKEQPSTERIETASNISARNIIKKQVSIKPIMSQKQLKDQKIKIIKLQDKKKNKEKKIQLKRLKKYASSLSEVMEISKQQFLEDITTENKQWESKRMYTDLFSRNKANLNFITTFLQKSNNFYQIVSTADLKPVYHSTSEVLSQIEAELLRQPQIQLPQRKRSSIDREQRCSNPPLVRRQKIIEKRSVIQQKHRSRYSRQRMTSNNIEQTDQLAKQKQIFGSQKQISQSQFVQINIKPLNTQPRQRLPEIFMRASSVDAAKQLKKQRLIKSIKQDLKNKIKQVGQVKQKQVVSLGANQKLLKGRQKMQNKIQLQLKTLGTNFFQQVGKKINKFCDLKKNLIV